MNNKAGDLMESRSQFVDIIYPSSYEQMHSEEIYIE